MMSFGPTPLLFHNLQADDDASHQALLQARSATIFAWGRLQGRLAHLAPVPAHFFSCSVVRLALDDALARAGFTGPADWLPAWFAGLRAPIGPTTHATVSPAPLADAVLGEMTGARWEPLALAARQIQAAARFDRGAHSVEDTARVAAVITAGERLVSQAHKHAASDEDNDVWPLSALGHLHDLAAHSLEFAPQTRERAITAGARGPVGFDLAAAPPPLWALDYFASKQTAPLAEGMTPLPLPGAIRAEALQPYLWPRERAILIARGMLQAVSRLSTLLDAALAASRDLERHLQAVRSTSRAPTLYRLLRGFGPLRPVQITTAIGVTKGGAHEIIGALRSAGLAKVTIAGGRKMIEAAELPAATAPRTIRPVREAELQSGSGEAIAAFDAAMADIDQLLQRLNRSNFDQ